MVATIVLAFCISVVHGLSHSPQLKNLAMPNKFISASQLVDLPLSFLGRRRSRYRQYASETDVRFYMYEPPLWTQSCNTSWTNLHAPQNEVVDVAIHRVLKRHPWRTSDPHKATIFVVPAYLTLSRVDKCGNHSKNMESTAQMLLDSPFFKQNGSLPNHLIAAFEFNTNEKQLGALGPLTKNMIVCHFERKDFDHPLVVPYAGQFLSQLFSLVAEPHTEWKELTERQHSLFFVGQADHRRAYRERRIMLRYLPSAFPDSILLQTPGVPGGKNQTFDDWPTTKDPIEYHEELPDCELSNLTTGCLEHRLFKENYTELGKDAKFNMVVHGDTPSTSRLYDAFQFGQIPIIISNGFDSVAQPFAKDVSWHDFAVFVEQSFFVADPVASITEAVKKAESKKKVQSLKDARKALDWFADPTCIGAALLSSAAREFLGIHDLPPAMSTQWCK